MSSHHFVIEGQEPALIIANGQRCQQELLDQVLEWCPFTLVLDGALQDVLDKGIAFNAVSGDFDSEPNPKEKTKDLHHVEIIETPNQEKTDLEKGVEICLEKGHNTIHIVWGTGARFDHSFGNLDLIVKLKEKVNLIFWDDYLKIYRVPSGFKKWFPAGQKVSLVPWPSCQNVNATNLLWPVHNLHLSMAKQLGTLNQIEKEGMFTLEYDTGDVLLMESLG